MSSDSLYFPLKLELDYSYALGDLKPYFDALSEGRALASRCPECGRVSFPPRLECELDRRESTWHELTGLGTVQRVTVGRTETLAQIAMDGAHNLFLGRLNSADIKKHDRVRLAALKSKDIAHPAQCAVFQRAD